MSILARSVKMGTICKLIKKVNAWNRGKIRRTATKDKTMCAFCAARVTIWTAKVLDVLKMTVIEFQAQLRSRV